MLHKTSWIVGHFYDLHRSDRNGPSSEINLERKVRSPHRPHSGERAMDLGRSATPHRAVGLQPIVGLTLVSTPIGIILV